MAEIIFDEKLYSFEHIGKDREIFRRCGENDEGFHVRFFTYRKPSASYGFLMPPDSAMEKGIAKMGASISRRLTGGGIALHGEDFCFSLFLSRKSFPTLKYGQAIHALMNMISGCLHEGTGLTFELFDERESGEQSSPFCFAKRSKFDICHDGIKVAGYAGRRNAEKMMIQVQLLPLNWGRSLLDKLPLNVDEIIYVPEKIKIFIHSALFLEYIIDGIENLGMNIGVSH